jgi:hypothetical protein
MGGLHLSWRDPTHYLLGAFAGIGMPFNQQLCNDDCGFSGVGYMWSAAKARSISATSPSTAGRLRRLQDRSWRHRLKRELVRPLEGRLLSSAVTRLFNASFVVRTPATSPRYSHEAPAIA